MAGHTHPGQLASKGVEWRRPLHANDLLSDAMTLPNKAAGRSNALAKAPGKPARRLPPPRMNLLPVPPGSRTLAVTEDAGLLELVETTGAADPNLALHWVTQAVNAGGPATGKMNGPELQNAVEHRSNLVLATVHGIGPQDAVEGMLAAQMTALHDLAMESMRRAQRAEHQDTLERAVKNATKLQGAFLAAVDGLKRWRGGTTVQRVVVEHVEVHAGGQAVVGAVATAGGGNGA